MNTNEIMIRGARNRAEFDAMMKSASVTFNVHIDNFIYLNRESPDFKLKNTRLCFAGGELAGGLDVLKRSTDIQGVSVPTGAVADVHLKKEHRGKGLGLALLDDAVDYMKGEGCVFSMLCSDRHGFYGRYGWRMVPVPRYLLDASTPLFPVPARYRAEKTELDYSLELLSEIIATGPECYTGCFVRGRAYKASLPRWIHVRDYSCYTAYEGEKPVAVCLLSKDPGAKTMWIHECRNRAGHDEAPKNLLRSALAETRRHRAMNLAGDLPETHPMAIKIMLLGGYRSATTDIMASILDLDKLMRLLRPSFEKKLKRARGRVPAGCYALNIADCGTVAFDWDGQALGLPERTEDAGANANDIELSEFIMRLMGVSRFHGKEYTRLNPLFETLLSPGDFIFWGIDRF